MYLSAYIRILHVLGMACTRTCTNYTVHVLLMYATVNLTALYL